MRERAQSRGIECHGILWIAEELSQIRLATNKQLLRTFELWNTDPFVRLPKEELNLLLAKFRNSILKLLIAKIEPPLLLPETNKFGTPNLKHHKGRGIQLNFPELNSVAEHLLLARRICL